MFLVGFVFNISWPLSFFDNRLSLSLDTQSKTAVGGQRDRDGAVQVAGSQRLRLGIGTQHRHPWGHPI